MTPFAVAAQGKGAVSAARRAAAIVRRYGITARPMKRRLDAVVQIINRYECGATIPITGAAARRHRRLIRRYESLGVEFAVHGYYHVDHVQLPQGDQLAQLIRARRLLQDGGLPAVGFRAPYLRLTDATLRAVGEAGFLYDASEAIHWPVERRLETGAYRRVLDFYGAASAATRVVVPRLVDGLVRIPYCLPDDEAVVERMPHMSPAEIALLWRRIFDATHARGELFILGVHPERITVCGSGITAVLDAARSAGPGVWVARLDEVARWWRQRTDASVNLTQLAPGLFRLTVQSPAGTTLLARGIQVEGAVPWADGYARLPSTSLTVRSERRPVIGAPASAPAELRSFLRQQGYIVEPVKGDTVYGHLLQRQRFSRADEQAVLAEVEGATGPLVRLGRWPHGARSAVCVTGDVDALTIWDYASRFLGR